MLRIVSFDSQSIRNVLDPPDSKHTHAHVQASQPIRTGFVSKIWIKKFYPCIVYVVVTSRVAGAVFGATGVMEAVVGAVGGLFVNYLYAQTLWISPGFIFIIVGCVYLLSTAVLVYVTHDHISIQLRRNK